MRIDVMRSFLARHLPAKSRWVAQGGVRGWLWAKLRAYYAKGRFPIRVPLHGRFLVLNAGNPYPFILADAPHFNSGLVAAVACLRQHLGRPLRIVDLGAAVGDTVALLLDRVPGCAESFLCVDGALENRPLFEANTAEVSGLSAHFVMLAARTGKTPSLVHHHPGTAMAAGREEVEAQTLDALLVAGGKAAPCDLIKSDLDGYDGEVLSGARETLVRDQPLVIFEWHPFLIRRCGNDHRAPFRALAEAGYDQLLWFSNRGPFSHRSAMPEMADVDWWNDFLIAHNHPMDPHFDIIALPPRLGELYHTIPQAAVYPSDVSSRPTCDP